MPVLLPAELLEAQRPLRASTSCSSCATAASAELVLAMTHEEIVTSHVAQRRALLPRPAADPLPLPDQGARRAAPARRRAAHARVHHEGLLHLRPRRGGPRRAATTSTSCAYDRIFDRAGLEWYRVESDVGMMGGLGAHEYMAPCAAGENEVALAPGYAANVEIASRRAAAGRAAAGRSTRPRPSTTPGPDHGRRGRRRARRARRRAAQGLPGRARTHGALRWSLVRGDHRVNEIKLQNALGARLPARAPGRGRPSASARPASSARSAREVEVLLDAAVAGRRRRLRRRRQRARPPPARRPAGRATSPSSAVDVRRVEAGDRVDGDRDPDRAGDRGRQHLQARHALLRAARRHLPGRGRAASSSIWMGSYGIGPGAHRRRGGRAVRRRAGDLLAARAGAVRRRAGRAGQARAATSATLAERLYDELRDGRARRPLRRPRRGPGREVRRRRAARAARCG